MTSKPGDAEIFKVDRRGRVHLPAARREALLDEFERSGASAPEFCRLVGINYGTFAGWWAKRCRERAVTAPMAASAPRLEVAASRPMPFFEAVVEKPKVLPAGEGLEIEMPGGGRLRISAEGQLPWAAELLRLLAPPEHRGC